MRSVLPVESLDCIPTIGAPIDELPTPAPPPGEPAFWTRQRCADTATTRAEDVVDRLQASVDTCRAEQAALKESVQAWREEMAQEMQKLQATVVHSVPAEGQSACAVRTSAWQTAAPRTSELSCASWNDIDRTHGSEKVQDKLGKSLRISQHGALDSDSITVDTWSFKQSSWDAAAFILNHDLLLPMESAMNAFVLLVNIAMQISFVIIVLSSLAETSIDDGKIEGFRWWRTNTGHSINLIDPLTQQSLASRVCEGDASLHLSDTQSSQVADIDAYLYDNAPFNGPLMCSLAMITWILTVSKEFYALLDMGSALAVVPRGTTVVTLDTSSEDSLFLMSLSTGRLVYLVSLGILRICIASTLLVAGAKYLAVTISIEDILLNAVALEFVLNVDELLYNALAPLKTRRLLVLLKPLRLPRGESWQGLDAKALAATAITFGFFAVAVAFWMVPEMEGMRSAKHELCGGRLDFSYAFGEAGFVIWAPEPSHRALEDTKDKSKSSSRFSILRSVIDEQVSNKTLAHRVDALAGPGNSVEALAQWDIVTWGPQANNVCIDLDDSSAKSFSRLTHRSLSSLRDAFKNQSIRFCSEIATYCNRYDSHGVVTRFWCPQTCGCVSPLSALVLPYPANGCSQSCQGTSSYAAAITSTPCSELPTGQLVSNSSWKAFVANWKTAASGFTPADKETLMWAHAYLVSEGCGAVARMSAVGFDLCSLPHMKSVSPFCPISCDCANRMSTLCPESCIYLR